MVIHYQPGRLRRNSDQPTAIADVMITSGSSYRTGDIPLGTPTCSARSRHGRSQPATQPDSHARAQRNGQLLPGGSPW
jgi:hypothetical protein